MIFILGECPEMAGDSVGICAFMCSNDTDCTEPSTRCCKTGCGGTTCMEGISL